MKMHLSRAFALAVLVSAATVPSAAFAQSDQASESQHYEKGVQFFKAGAFDAAVLEFEAAHKAGGNFKHLYNIGVCRQELRDYPAAVDAYTRYLADGGSQIDGKRKEEVNEQLTQLRGLVRRVNFQTRAPNGTEVFVDDVRIGVVPIPPFSVKVGQRKFSMTFGSQVATKVLPVASGSADTTVELEFPEASVGPVVPGESKPPEIAKPEPPSFPILPWAITGALGVGAVVFDVLAVSNRNAQARLEATYGVNPADIHPKAVDARTYALIGDVLTVGAIGGALLSTYFTIRYVSKKNSTQVGVAPAALMLQGRF
jgi:hypothetical protein